MQVWLIEEYDDPYIEPTTTRVVSTKDKAVAYFQEAKYLGWSNVEFGPVEWRTEHNPDREVAVQKEYHQGRHYGTRLLGAIREIEVE